MQFDHSAFIDAKIDEYPLKLNKRQIEGRVTIRLDEDFYDEFPQQILLLKQLKTLDLSRTIIKEIPAALNQLKTLKYVILPSNMQWIPQGLGQYLKAETLPAPIAKKLEQEGITLQEALATKELTVHVIPENIGLYVNLESLHLSSWFIGFPRSIFRLSKLKTLKIDAFQIKIPDDIARLTSLERLYLAQDTRELPEALKTLPNLKEMHFKNSFLHEGDIDTIMEIENLEVLTIVNNNYSLFNTIRSTTLRVLHIIQENKSVPISFLNIPNTVEDLFLSGQISFENLNPNPKLKKIHLNLPGMHHLDNLKIVNPELLEEFIYICSYSDSDWSTILYLILNRTPNLKKLTLRDTTFNRFKLKTVYDDKPFENLTNLIELNIKDYDFITPRVFLRMPNLKRLTVARSGGYPQFEYILPQGLEFLDLEFVHFPFRFNGVSQLKELKLNRMSSPIGNTATYTEKLINLTDITILTWAPRDLQNNIHKLPNLTTFTYNSSLSPMQSDQAQRYATNISKSLTLKHFHLVMALNPSYQNDDYQWMRIENLAPFLRVPALESLVIDSQVITFPADIPVPANLKKLAVRNVSTVSNDGLTDWVSKMTYLQDIEITYYIPSPPVTIMDFSLFTNLQNLYLRNARLNYTGFIKGLKNLRTVKLEYCELQILTNDICDNKNLIELNLNGNTLTTLPVCLGNLKNLRLLSVEDNALVMLPPLPGFIQPVKSDKLPKIGRYIRYRYNPIHYKYHGDYEYIPLDVQKFKWMQKYYEHAFKQK